MSINLYMIYIMIPHLEPNDMKMFFSKIWALEGFIIASLADNKVGLHQAFQISFALLIGDEKLCIVVLRLIENYAW